MTTAARLAAFFMGLMIAGPALAGVPTASGVVAESGTAPREIALRLQGSRLRYLLHPSSSADASGAMADILESKATNRSVVVRYDPDSGVFDQRTLMLTYQVRELLYRGDSFTGVVKPPRRSGLKSRRAVAERDLAHGIALRAAEDLVGARLDIEAALASGALPPKLEAMAVSSHGGLAGHAALLAPPGDERDRLLLAALADYRRWQTMAPEDVRAARVIAAVYSGLGAYDEAAAAFHDIADRWPDDTYWALIDMGRAYRLKGDYAKALAALDELVARSGPQTGTAYHYHRGRTLMALGRLDEAVAEFALGIEGQPDYAYAHTERACALARLGRLAEALDDQRKGLDQIRKDEVLRSDEGGERQDLDRAAAVVADLEHRAAIAPTTPTDAACGGYFDGTDISRARSPMLTSQLPNVPGAP